MFWEIFKNSGILALFGVVVGFLLSEISTVYKKHQERKEAKASLLDEARFNYHQSINKINILNQAIDALERQQFLSTKCTKYSTIEFENLYHIALPKLTIIERDNLRHLNSFYLTVDKLLDEFDDSFKKDIDSIQIRQNTLESVYKNAATFLRDVKNSLSKSLEISSNLIDGNPLAIFGNNSKGA